MIDAAGWLALRIPVPPPQLARRLSSIVEGRVCADLTELSAVLVDEALNVVSGLSDDRSGAFDLLVADALITYAMEAAAEDGPKVESIALDAMQRIAHVAGREAQP